jgi:hypothetical protein
VADKCNADLLIELARWKSDRDALVAAGASSEAIGEVDARRVAGELLFRLPQGM